VSAEEGVTEAEKPHSHEDIKPFPKNADSPLSLTIRTNNNMETSTGYNLSQKSMPLNSSHNIPSTHASSSGHHHSSSSLSGGPHQQQPPQISSISLSARHPHPNPNIMIHPHPHSPSPHQYSTQTQNFPHGHQSPLSSVPHHMGQQHPGIKNN
jgi:hypothetical protein